MSTANTQHYDVIIAGARCAGAALLFGCRAAPCDGKTAHSRAPCEPFL